MEIDDPRVRTAVARFVAESTGDVVVVSDADAVVRWASPSTVRLTGWRPAELVGRRTFDFVHADDVEALGRLRATPGDVEGLLRIRRADGSHMWVRLLSRRLLDDAGEAVARVSVFRDVDSEVASRAALAESEHWYRLLAENLTDFVTMASPDGVLTWASPSATSTLGWLPDDVYGRPTVSFLHPEDVPRLVALREEMAAGRTSLLRARVQRADGTYRWFDLSIRPVVEDGVLVGRATAYRDVQAEVEAQTALAASERQFRLLAENAADVVVQVEGDVVAWASPSLTSALGWEPAAWIGEHLDAFVHPDDLAAARSQRQTATEGPARQRYRLRGCDGRYRWVDSHGGPYGDRPGAWVASFRVIDDLVRTEAELDRRARYDTVTGLLNRHEVFERLAVRDRRSGRSTAVLFCDLDRFKDINDTLGHAAGDEVLRVVAERVRDAIRGDDLAARIGGDELLVVTPGVHDLAEGVAIAEAIRRAVVQPVPLPEGSVTPTLSIGVTLARPDEDPDALVARADEAMYEAKREGRDRVIAR